MRFRVDKDTQRYTQPLRYSPGALQLSLKTLHLPQKRIGKICQKLLCLRPMTQQAQESPLEEFTNRRLRQGARDRVFVDSVDGCEDRPLVFLIFLDGFAAWEIPWNKRVFVSKDSSQGRTEIVLSSTYLLRCAQEKLPRAELHCAPLTSNA